jgi:hypothetical protein
MLTVGLMSNFINKKIKMFRIGAGRNIDNLIWQLLLESDEYIWADLSWNLMVLPGIFGEKF